MEVLWQRGPSTVQQVLDDLSGEKLLAYNSVLTTIRILEKKGYVAHAKSKDASAYVYAPDGRALRGHPFGSSPPGAAVV